MNTSLKTGKVKTATDPLCIYTDGSTNKDTSTWGFLIKNKKRKLVMGECPSFFSSPTESEGISVVKALEYILKNYKSLKRNNFIIYTDCQCLTNLKKPRVFSKRFSLQNEIKKEIIILSEEIKYRGLSLKIEHIRGHQKILQTDYILNGCVDVAVRKLRKEISKSKKETKSQKVKRLIYSLFLKRSEIEIFINRRYWIEMDSMIIHGNEFDRLERVVILGIKASLRASFNA